MHPEILLSVLFALVTSCSGARIPFYDDVKYNQGEYGRYVSQDFKSNPDVIAPVFNFIKPFSACDDGSYLFITPRGHVVDPKAMIVDVNGSVIWSTTREYGKIYDLRVQQYKGKPHLTFWAGNDVIEGHGMGYHYVLDQSYEEVFKFTGFRNSGADLHVFTITPKNTAIFIYYNSTLTDTSSLSKWRARGYVWDSMFFELDLETSAVLFRWSSLEHLNLTSSTVGLNAASPESPYDPFHLNSVSKDSRGNFLLSFRYTNSILYIDGKSGSVLWQLGGRDNHFHDLSSGSGSGGGGNATAFAGQHDVQWVTEGRTLSFFDNSADWYHELSDHSRGVRINLDTNAMTASLDQEFLNPAKILSASQGSYQTLPNGNVLLGYGFNGVFTEFSPGGEVLCDAYFQPSVGFGSGDVQSYRAMKFKWTARPNSNPDVFLDKKERKLYVSWNGATEVRGWEVQGCDDEGVLESGAEESVGFRKVGEVVKVGFETEYAIDGLGDGPRFLRVAGVDSKGKALGFSKVVDVGDLIGVGSATQAGSGGSEKKEGAWKFEFPQVAMQANPVYRISSFVAVFVVIFVLVRFGRRRMFGHRSSRRGRS